VVLLYRLPPDLSGHRDFIQSTACGGAVQFYAAGFRENSRVIYLSDVSTLKQAQRKTALQIRKELVEDSAGLKAAEIFLNNIDVKVDAKVSLYWPIGSELDTRPLISALHKRKISCFLPVVVDTGEPLVFREWTSDIPLVKGKHDVEVPPDSAAEGIPDIIITPLLAFDEAGFRMGYGGGFYDRTLERIRALKPCVAVGFAYAGQEIEKVVTNSYDEKMNWIVTEKEIRKIQ